MQKAFVRRRRLFICGKRLVAELEIGAGLLHAATAFGEFTDGDKLVSAADQRRDDGLGGIGGCLVQIMHQYDIAVFYMV